MTEPLLPYRNPDLPVEARVNDLLQRMSLEEKAAQMQCVWREKAVTLVDELGAFDPVRAAAHFGHGHGLGQVGRPSDAGGGLDPRRTAELTNDIQRFFVEHSRLGIPVIFHEECLHGLAAAGATSFPQPIGLAATFDPELVRRLYAMTAAEARTRGAHQALTPVLDVARDPRWGRVEETFGEDPHLVGRMGVAAIQGFQGRGDVPGRLRLIATLKHFAAHGQPESGNNCAPANVSPRTLREVFLEPFRAAVVEGGAISVMASYNEIDGVPSHANRWLLRDVLRGEWEFPGYVVSDYDGIRELNERPELVGNYLAADPKAAARLAVQAGVNIELPDPDCYRHVVDLVREGALDESEIDELVRPMLAWKFRLGLFERPYVIPALAVALAECPPHRELALEAARETITLLKNEGSLAPLDPAVIKTLAVIGPNADRVLLGGYSGKPTYASTVLSGIRARLGDAVKILHHEGCRITIGGSWEQDEVVPGDPAEDRRLIAEAVAVARQADVILLAVGGNEQTSREAYARNHLGDRTSLDLVGRQDELAEALVATGRPVIALLFNGRPLSVRRLAGVVPVLFECWYLGQETGPAVAEVLFGDVTPGGKLPITIPRSVGHLPAFYNHKPAARRGYLFDEVDPLFAFGFGLSYTRFTLSAPQLGRERIGRDESTEVSIDVANVGDRPGDEVIQLYIRDLVSSVTRPVKELKGFERVRLAPGETRTVSLPITPDHLAFYNLDMDYTVEPGDFRILVGTSSREVDLQSVTLQVTE